MNLGALLSELRGNVLRDDAELASGPSDHLWSDETLVRYINDAYLRFSRRTLALRDASTPEVVEVPLDAGVSLYELHASILSVVSARYDVDTNDLMRVGRAIMQNMTPPDPVNFDPSSPAAMTPGRPIAVGTDEAIANGGLVSLTVWPAPTSTEAGKLIHLRVARKPLVPFTLDDVEAECELPEEYQIDMLEWAAYRAQNTSDVDGASAAAEKHRAAFEAAVAEVMRDVRRKMFAPLQFQYGRNGFTWSP
jgi:hypothetical protein